MPVVSYFIRTGLSISDRKTPAFVILKNFQAVNVVNFSAKDWTCNIRTHSLNETPHKCKKKLEASYPLNI